MFFPVYVIFSDCLLSSKCKVHSGGDSGAVSVSFICFSLPPGHWCRVDFIHYPPLSNEWIQQVSARVGVRAEYVEVLTLSALECDYIWRQVLSRGSYVKMRSCEFLLIQYNWCPYKKRVLVHRHVCRKDHVRTKGEGDCPQTRRA